MMLSSANLVEAVQSIGSAEDAFFEGAALHMDNLVF